MFSKQSAFLFLCLFASVAVTGCGGSDRPPLASASGVVSLDGVPVEGATVSFVPVEGGRPATAITNEEGRYQISAYTDADGVAVGEHMVSIMKIEGEGAFMLEGADDDPLAGGGDESATGDDALSPGIGAIDGVKKKRDAESLTEYVIPKKYINAKTSGLKVTVPSEGSDSLDFELSR